MNYEYKLRDLLREGIVIPVVGAGVSYATAGLPGWYDLVKSGLNYAEDRKADPSLIEEAQGLLKTGKLTEAASIVKELLKAPGHPFNNWLNDIFSRPKTSSSSLIESIQNLCQPIIATTNYDDLLRNVGAAHTDLVLDWKQHEEIQSCLSNHREFLLHLHGIYTRPDTTIFGADDYDNLKKQLGYKTILSQLWMNKHFLFIGCSRDGVMDEDFSTVLKLMNDWFPSSSNEHYILMLEQEIGSASHWELMQMCNVHIIPYGDNHSKLPDFINGINPNAGEIAKRLLQHRKHAYNSIKAILQAQPIDQLESFEIDGFIKDYLGLSYYWVDNNRLKIFEEALNQYNLEINNKQQAFRNRQLLTQSIVNVSALQEKIEVWHKNWRNTAPLNNIEFINMGILAYERLKAFPSDILEDIHLRHHGLIHHGFFSGHLRQFYHEAIDWKRNSGKHSVFDDDYYFFENLRRIMDSLAGVLSLEVTSIYSEKQPAIIAREFSDSCLLFITNTNLTIREPFYPYKIFAELPWDENLSFIDAQFIEYRGDKIIIGYNAKSCFKWNPRQDLTVANFYTAGAGEVICDMVAFVQNESVIVELYTNSRKVMMVDFNHIDELKLLPHYGGYVRIESLGRTYCHHPSYIGTKGDSVFEYTSLGEYEPKISTVDLWDQLKGFTLVREAHSRYLERQDDNNNIDLFYPFISDTILQKVKWIDKEILIVRCKLMLPEPHSSVLLFIDPDMGFDKPVLKILFPNKICFSFDTFVINNRVNLLVGYLDFGEVDYLIQFFEDINLQEMIIASDQAGMIPQEKMNRSTTRDMFQVDFATSEKAFIIEEGKILHDITLLEMYDIETAIDGGIKSIRYYDLNRL